MRQALAALLLFAVPAHAQAIDVDKLLAVLAEVVQDRAKQVAANTVKDWLVEGVCDRSLELPLPAAGDAGSTSRTLHLGADDCLTGTRECTADDLFLKTCRLANAPGGLSLTDVAFLKALARDAVGLALRLAAARVDARRFADLGLDALGPALYRVAEVLSRSNAADEELTEVLFELAEALEADTRSDVLTTIGGSPEAKALLEHTSAAASASVSVASLDERRCTDWSTSARDRARTFGTLFRASGGFPRDAACPSGNKACAEAQLGLRLGDLAMKLRCGNTSRETYRQLGLVMSEQLIYADAFRALDSPQGADTLERFFQRVRREVVLAPARDEVATGIRLIAATLRARTWDREQLEAWLRLIEDDARRALDATDYTLLLKSDALAWDTRSRWPDSVRVVRDAAKDFLTQPRLVTALSRQAPDAPQRQQALRELMGLFARLRATASKPAAAERPGQRVARLLRTISSVSTALPADDDATREQLATMRKALDLSAEVVELGERRDWVGLALSIGSSLDSLSRPVATLPRELFNALRFVRVLMAVHQAATPEEAKATFTAALQDIASRAERFDGVSIDLAALVAVRFGLQVNGSGPGDPPTLPRELMAGLFAPFGLQVAWRWIGLLISPVDLGSYLVAQESGAPPKAAAAIRLGLTAYARPSRTVPIVVGVGYDYRPPFETWAMHRLSIFAALELPLFTLH